jgi:DNA-binding GntR family transcriptional regulator
MGVSSSIIHHKPLKEEIYEVLHAQIIAGTYVPGEWLRQEEISSRMGVSMTPVREALDLLAAAGLAERVPYRGVRVVDLSSREIVEAYGKRLLLEGLAARMAAIRITPAEIQRLTRLVNEMQQCVGLKDMSDLRQLSRQFHLSVVKAADDGLLVRLYGIVANSFPDWMLYEAMFHHPELLTSSLAEEQSEHRALLQSLIDHDGPQAANISTSHVLHLGKHLESLLGVPGADLREQEEGIIPSTPF